MTYVILQWDWNKWNRGGGTRCEEGVSIKGQSQCEIWSGEYWLGVLYCHGYITMGMSVLVYVGVWVVVLGLLP